MLIALAKRCATIKIALNHLAGVLCTRFPMPKKGAGATDHYEYSSLIKAIAMIMTTIALCILAAIVGVGGSASMITAFAINLAAHFAIVVGSRVEGIAASKVEKGSYKLVTNIVRTFTFYVITQ